MEPIRTLVVDDEPEARAGVIHLLQGDPEIRVVGEGRTGLEAVEAIQASRPELVFLDIQMPELDGFGVLARVGPPAPVVVFITAYDEYALQAFEVHALDYLRKPFSDARFSEALARAKTQVLERRMGQLGHQLAGLLHHDAKHTSESIADPAPKEVASTTSDHYLDRMMVRTPNGVSFVRVEEIDWIEARNYCAKLHVAGREYLIRETMQRLARKLDPRRFVRIHRSAIVNLDRIETLEPYFHGSYVVLLRDRTRLTLSRTRRANLERALGHALR
ncbi:MAG TPA: LytTR family DNA-binding domain-containing protein [Gemmatimonadales bacterium]|nr:LytTR family DNA-binding domain-containing protein [Gemmatimonadales bacterium]